jgi:hypothetical protein
LGEVVKLVAAALAGLLLLGSCSSDERNGGRPVGPADPVPKHSTTTEADDTLLDEEEAGELAFRIVVSEVLPGIISAEDDLVHEFAETVCDLTYSVDDQLMFALALTLIAEEEDISDGDMASVAGAALAWKCPDRLEWLEEAM